jgi:predicted phage terminase large subunit-like protein
MEDLGVQTSTLSIREAVALGAVDNEVYARTFFTKTFRQPSPPFQRELWRDLDDPRVRYSNQRIFRGGGKTTIARVNTSKRIAYGVSKTILYVGASEGAAARSGAWLRNNVERNKLWSGAFNLTPGRKWTDIEFEIWHGTLQTNIWCLFVGITGNIRGINFDDYRPDYIVLDDILTDENCATLEQRTKISDLVHGALKKSLAPVVDDPNAKLSMLVTPQHRDDVSSVARGDPTWSTIEVPCWTRETMQEGVDKQLSAWPERYATEDLRKEKRAAIATNQLSVFAREMELQLTSPELACFRGDWLKYFSEPYMPSAMNVLAIDPTPPPSDAQLAKNMVGSDFEVIHVWGRRGDNYYLQERRASRGETPDWTIANVFEMALKHRVMSIIVESVAYQRTLKWLLEKEMARRRVYFSVVPFLGGNKYARIRSVLSGQASHGHIWVHPDDTPFIQQFETYSSSDHDDELDCATIALSALINPHASQGDDGYGLSEVEPLEFVRGAP